MVFTTFINLLPINRGEDKSWKRFRVFRHSAHFYGRRRNCYKIARIAVMRCIWHATKGRKNRRKDLNDLNEARLEAGSCEHGLTRKLFREGLERSLILLNQHILADLAIWEPRSFKALTDVSKARIQQEPDLEYLGMDHKDVSHIVSQRLLPKVFHDWK